MWLVVGRVVWCVLCMLVVWLDGWTFFVFFFLMIRRPPRSTQSRSSAASDVYKRQELYGFTPEEALGKRIPELVTFEYPGTSNEEVFSLSLIHISEPTRLLSIPYAVFCLKKKTKTSRPTSSPIPYRLTRSVLPPTSEPPT